MKETVTTDNVKYLFIQKTSQADIFVSFLPKYVTLPICCSRNFLHPSWLYHNKTREISFISYPYARRECLCSQISITTEFGREANNERKPGDIQQQIEKDWVHSFKTHRKKQLGFWLPKYYRIGIAFSSNPIRKLACKYSRLYRTGMLLKVTLLPVHTSSLEFPPITSMSDVRSKLCTSPSFM